jgi:hypothetical protein
MSGYLKFKYTLEIYVKPYRESINQINLIKGFIYFFEIMNVN